MTLHRLRRVSPEVVEPPRDGEFFFEEAFVEKEIARLAKTLRGITRFGDWIGAAVGRHPIIWVSVAAFFGIVTTSVVSKL